METSLQRVEKLVHATNSALAQMKFSLMFDDLSGEEGYGRADAFREPKLSLNGDEEDFRQCQEVFKSEANEMFSKMEMIESREWNTKTSKAIDRIKEINRKMNIIRQKRGKPTETGIGGSRQKLLGLITGEKSTSEKPDCSGSYPTSEVASFHRKEVQLPEKRQLPFKKADPPLARSPVKSKEELKKKILETREIVDRGFHTARLLAQKVENMAKNENKEKTPNSEKTESDMYAKSFDSKIESKETTKNVKCLKHQRTEEKVEGDETLEEKLENAKLVDIRRKEYRRGRRTPHLRTQRLPSVHIKRGLQLQKVHSLEIPAQGDKGCAKVNTGIHILSHEQIEKSKMETVLEEIRRENCCCYDVSASECRNAFGNYVECPNCGSVLRVYRSTGAVDPRKLDEILRKCNFNVFDPRIDEFVEKYGAADSERWYEELPEVVSPEECSRFKKTEVEGIKETKKKTKNDEKGEIKMEEKHFSLEELSSRLSIMYRREADALEGTYLKLDSLLKTLLSKLDESREAFEECHFFRNERVLTATKPVVVNLTGTLARRRRKRRLDKKDVKNRNKSRTEEGQELPFSLPVFIKSPETNEVRRIPPLCEVRGRHENLSRKKITTNKVRSGRTSFRKLTQGSHSLTSTSSCQNISPSKEERMIEKALIVSTQNKKVEVQQGRLDLKETHTESVASSSKQQCRSKVKKKSFFYKSVSAGSVPELGKLDIRAVVVDGQRSSPASANIDDGGRKEIEKIRSELWESNEEKAQLDGSTEKSDSHYESDFESSTNEPEDEPEPEAIACTNKLSTISEVDSELERKIRDEQKIPSGNAKSQVLLEGLEEEIFCKNHRRKFDLIRSKNISPLASEGSSRKAEDAPSRTGDASLKSTPTELITSLKDILSALKDQFARTETLAEKLTENANQETIHYSSVQEGIRSPRRMVEGLHSARRKGGFIDSLSEDGGSSLGEVMVGSRRKGQNSLKSDRILLKPQGNGSSRAEAKISATLNESSVEVSYSEGEIPNNLLLDSECCSSHSVGEIHS